MNLGNFYYFALLSFFGHLPIIHQAQRNMLLTVENTRVVSLVHMTMLVKNKPCKTGLLGLKAWAINKNFFSAKIWLLRVSAWEQKDLSAIRKWCFPNLHTHVEGCGSKPSLKTTGDLQYWWRKWDCDCPKCFPFFVDVCTRILSVAFWARWPNSWTNSRHLCSLSV